MYNVYGIIQGEREVDLSVFLPFVVEAGTRGLLASYLWCIKRGETGVLVDTGMTHEEAKNMLTAKNLGGEKYVEHKLKKLGVDPAAIESVIISHLHRDHFSAYQLYPKATFYIQRRDIEFFTGPATRLLPVNQFAANMPEVISLAYKKRIRYLDGDTQIAPGIRAVLIGGHTPGTQVVVVTTGKGEAVICGDAMDLYRNMEEGVTGIGVDLLEAFLGLDKIKALASSPELIIPSHDPLIMERFPSRIEGVVEIA